VILMPDNPNDEPKIHVDSDWKQEAAREKERLAEETAGVGEGPGDLPEPSFHEIISMIFTQALIGLGGMQTPDGRQIPPDVGVARHYIDLLGVLATKTENNLTDEEKQTLGAALYELRMRFVQASGKPESGPPPGGDVKPE
jgi:hypothetical protein